ncbi:hypothetical protein FKM82_022753 [Ascaphus truei]
MAGCLWEFLCSRAPLSPNCLSLLTLPQLRLSLIVSPSVLHTSPPPPVLQRVSGEPKLPIRRPSWFPCFVGTRGERCRLAVLFPAVGAPGAARRAEVPCAQLTVQAECHRCRAPSVPSGGHLGNLGCRGSGTPVLPSACCLLGLPPRGLTGCG